MSLLDHYQLKRLASFIEVVEDAQNNESVHLIDAEVQVYVARGDDSDSVPVVLVFDEDGRGALHV